MAARRAPVALAAGAVALALALGVLFGTEPIDVGRALRAPGIDRTILLSIRAPHVALAAIAGAGLAAVGAAFQGLLKNPLAEPFVLGVSGGAAFGATTAIALGVATAGWLGAAVVPASAFAGGLAATWLVHTVARRSEAESGTTILLAGVMVNGVAAALITFLKTLVSPSRALLLLRWLTGFVELPSGPALAVVAASVALGVAALLFDAGRLNLLALGDDAAAHLGVDVQGLERRVFLASSVVVGAIVSLTGLIGFVGLVVPHVLRRLLGPDHRVLVPASLAFGAVALVACDLAARVSFRWLGTEPPVGAITALVGGPFFLVLLARRGA